MAIFVAAQAVMLASISAEPAQQAGQKSPAQVKQFHLLDPQGAAHEAAEWRGRKAVVLLFLGTECPVSNGYTPVMTALAEKYSPRGVAFYGVHPDPDVTPAAAAKHAADYRLSFPVLLDPAQIVSEQAGVEVTPEAVILSPEGQVLYRGRIDDRYSVRGKRRDEPRVKDLELALDEILTGKSPSVAETKAFGCPLPEPLTPAK
jgi:peroxiredoxin